MSLVVPQRDASLSRQLDQRGIELPKLRAIVLHVFVLGDSESWLEVISITQPGKM